MQKVIILFLMAIAVASAIRWNFNNKTRDKLGEEVERECRPPFANAERDTVVLACARKDTAARRKDFIEVKLSTKWAPRFVWKYFRVAPPARNMSETFGPAPTAPAAPTAPTGFGRAVRSVFHRVILYTESNNETGYQVGGDTVIESYPTYTRPTDGALEVWSKWQFRNSTDKTQLQLCSSRSFGDGAKVYGRLNVRICAQVAPKAVPADKITDADADPDAGNVDAADSKAGKPRLHPNSLKWGVTILTGKPLPQGVHVALRISREVRAAAVAPRRYRDEVDAQGLPDVEDQDDEEIVPDADTQDDEVAEVLDEDEDKSSWAVSSFSTKIDVFLVQQKVVKAHSLGRVVAIRYSKQDPKAETDLPTEPALERDGGDGPIVTGFVRRIAYYAFLSHNVSNVFVWDPEGGFVTNDDTAVLPPPAGTPPGTPPATPPATLTGTPPTSSPPSKKGETADSSAVSLAWSAALAVIAAVVLF